MNRAANRVLARFLLDTQRLMDALESGAQTVRAWRQAFSAALAKYHTAAFLAGQGSTTLSGPAKTYLGKTVAAQIGFLKHFATEIQDTDAFKPGWHARAAMYAQGIGQSYWKGMTQMLPLPALPRDGTSQCLSNCGCAWEVEELDGDGNYDAYWRRAKDDSCQTCVQRERDWSPYRIREGRAA